MIDKNCASILDAWAKYTGYNPEQCSFMLGSAEYEFHKACKKITDILENFEPTGELAVIFAKKSFYNIINKCKVSVFDVLDNPGNLDAEKEMYNIFNSLIVDEIESHYLDSCDALIQKIHGKKMLGERDKKAERNILYNSIETVVDNIQKLNIDAFRKGGEFIQINKFSTSVHIFETMAECILSIERYEDGIFLCFITDHGTTGGYFSFIINTNGNIVSLNDRVNEAYQGQHKHSRNGRWMESKQYDLFPYNMMKYDGCDYKGYATRMQIDASELHFLSFGPERYLPIVLTMVTLSKKYVGKIDLPLKLSSSLLVVNRLKEPAVNALIAIGESVIVENHNTFHVDFTSEDVRAHKLSEEYSYKNKNADYSERGAFFPHESSEFYKNSTFELVDMYSDGFEVDYGLLNKLDYHPRLYVSHEDNEQMDSEYIGTYNRMRMQSYMDARTQLAMYIRKKIWKEFNDYGGIEGVHQWYKQAVNNSIQHIYKLCVEWYKAGGEKKCAAPGWTSTNSEFLYCIAISTGYYPNYTYRSHVFNTPKHGVSDKFLCPITENTASMWFVFSPRNWTEIRQIVQTDLPKVVKGWQKDGHECPGNSLLEAHDPALAVGTPMERDESYKYEKEYGKPSEYNFVFAIGFSKRGFNKLLKEDMGKNSCI